MLELANRAKGSLKMNLLQTVDDVNQWIQGMVDLSLHLDEYADNQLVSRDIKEVPQRISKVKQRIEMESRKAGSESVVNELQRQLRALEQQLENLQAATTNAKRAEIQLETALASLGTMYSQMSRLGTSEVDSSKMNRMRGEIQEEVASLQDLIHAMDEVQATNYNDAPQAEARRMRLS
jgi:chromosome segregation ATPase